MDTDCPNQKAGETITVSIVVPVKDEEAAIDAFVDRVSHELGSIVPDGAWEILFVDDGSRDSTLERIASRNSGDERIRGISLSRCFGKEAALSAGLDFARGDAIVPMDVDLQEPPELLGPMLEKWREGADVVHAVRASRKSDSILKRVSASLYYRTYNLLAPDPIPENVGDFRLMDRVVVEAVRQLPERNRFMKGLFAWSGFKQAAVEYVRTPRSSGRTKFRYWKLWTLALDGITATSTLPLKIWSYVGLVAALLAIGYAGFLTVRTLVFGVDVPGYASLMVVVLVFGSLQFISLGILGEYVGRILIETKQRPIYIVRRKIGIEVEESR